MLLSIERALFQSGDRRVNVDRLILTARVQAVRGALSSEAILAGLAEGNYDSPGSMLLATGEIGAGEPCIQAAETLKRNDVVGIIAPAFSWPFFRLCINIGLPPLTLWEAGEIRTGDRLRIDVNSRVVKSMSAGTRYPIRDLSDQYIEILACGGIEGYVQARLVE